MDVEDKSGKTALHYAANGDHIKMARLLLKHGAQVNYEVRNHTPRPRWVSFGARWVTLGHIF